MESRYELRTVAQVFLIFSGLFLIHSRVRADRQAWTIQENRPAVRSEVPSPSSGVRLFAAGGQLAERIASAESAPPPKEQAVADRDYPFFPFCIDWHDSKKRSFAEQAS